MRTHLRILLSCLLGCLVAVSMVACGEKAETGREYKLQGQVLSVAADRKEATIKHEDIQGFMPAMTMPYKVREAAQFEGVAPGDLITATLVVLSSDAYIKDVKKVGTAPLEKPAVEKPSASSGSEVLKEGEAVPDAKFLDQNGRTVQFRRAFAGQSVLLTFIYTRCPMPNFCPLMDRQFKAIQAKLEANPALRTHLVTITIDPANDTPAVLAAHAKKLGADPKRWTFLTGDRNVIDQFASRVGLFTTRDADDPTNITHNLRTVIVDSHGNLAKVFTGNEWTPDEALAGLDAVAAHD